MKPPPPATAAGSDAARRWLIAVVAVLVFALAASAGSAPARANAVEAPAADAVADAAQGLTAVSGNPGGGQRGAPHYHHGADGQCIAAACFPTFMPEVEFVPVAMASSAALPAVGGFFFNVVSPPPARPPRPAA